MVAKVSNWPNKITKYDRLGDPVSAQHCHSQT